MRVHGVCKISARRPDTSKPSACRLECRNIRRPPAFPRIGSQSFAIALPQEPPSISANFFRSVSFQKLRAYQRRTGRQNRSRYFPQSPVRLSLGMRESHRSLEKAILDSDAKDLEQEVASVSSRNRESPRLLVHHFMSTPVRRRPLLSSAGRVCTGTGNLSQPASPLPPCLMKFRERVIPSATYNLPQPTNFFDFFWPEGFVEV